MTELQKRFGPFSFAGPRGFFGGKYNYMTVCGIEDRMKMVRMSTDCEWLAAVIAHEHTQKTVRQAAERRLRWCDKACKALLAKYHEQNTEVKP